MARDPGLIQLELEALRSARASGQASIREGDRSIQYRSDVELRNAIAALESELREASAATQVRNVVVRTASGKGW